MRRQRSVAAHAITPAPARVASAPIPAATGPVSANEIGTREVETSQSRLVTRPSRRTGTRDWISVPQTIRPEAKSACWTKDDAIACQRAVAKASPAMPRHPTAQATYMKVMCLRGRPSCAITTAARIAPTPPAARTRPKSSAPPPRSFLIRYGTSTSTGPQNASSEIAAPSSVPHSQAWRRTKRNPSRRSASADCGTDESHHERTDELVERVRLHEHPLRDDLRHRGVERRAEERVSRAEDDREQEQVPELE